MNSLAEETTLQFNNILLFGKFGMADVVVKDGGLAKYINLKPDLIAAQRRKARQPLVR